MSTPTSSREPPTPANHQMTLAALRERVATDATLTARQRQDVASPVLDSTFRKAVLGQQLARLRPGFSITGGDLWLRGGQPGTASRMLGGRAMLAALNSGPTVPVAGVRRVTC
jgi:hypothetical protein